MAEIKLGTDELHTLAKQMINASEVFSKRNDKIGNYAAELTVNCAFARLGRIYDMIQEASAAGAKRASELKELADKASKIQFDFTNADDDGASIKAPSTEDDIQLGLSQMAEYLPFVNVINDASIAFTGKDIGGVGKDPDEIQESKLWTMVNAATFGLGGLEKDVFKRGMKDERKVIKTKDYGKYSTLIDSKVKEIKKAYLPNTLSKTFTDSNYRTVITKEKIIVYRTFGGKADAGGAFVTTIPAESRIQAKIDTALLPSWGNSRMYEAKIEIPKGEILNIGKVEEQTMESGAKLCGGADQVVLPLNWNLDWIKEIRLVPSI